MNIQKAVRKARLASAKGKQGISEYCQLIQICAALQMHPAWSRRRAGIHMPKILWLMTGKCRKSESVRSRLEERMAKRQEIKVEVEFTEGFEERFTRACLDVISSREKY